MAVATYALRPKVPLCRLLLKIRFSCYSFSFCSASLLSNISLPLSLSLSLSLSFSHFYVFIFRLASLSGSGNFFLHLTLLLILCPTLLFMQLSPPLFSPFTPSPFCVPFHLSHFYHFPLPPHSFWLLLLSISLSFFYASLYILLSLYIYISLFSVPL